MDKIFNYLVSARCWVSFVLIIICILLWRLLARARKKALAAGNTNVTAASLIFDALKYVLLIFIILGILQVNNINVTSLLAGLGIVSAVVGLALQDILKDVIMGMHILGDRFFVVGDMVSFNGSEGVIESFNVRTTKIRCLNGDLINICNRDITRITLMGNESYADIPLPYEEDPKETGVHMDKLTGIIRELPDVDECSCGGIQEFADSAVIYRLIFKCAPEKRYAVRRSIQGTVFGYLKENGIEIPYNKLDITTFPGV